jgi:hypothetical protein
MNTNKTATLKRRVIALAIASAPIIVVALEAAPRVHM